MELITKEDKYFPGYSMPLYFEKNADLMKNTGEGERYRCIMFRDGSGTLAVSGRKKIFVSPSVLSLNETEHIDNIDSASYTADVFYFHPEIVNSRFSLEFLNSGCPGLSITEGQDLFCLQPYIKISTAEKQCVQPGISGYTRINELAKKIVSELTSHGHNTWPCLTRSYLLEFLFYIRQAVFSGSDTETPVGDDDIERVLLYINTNYHQKITIDDITSRFDTNRTTLSKKFQTVTGTSVIAYLNKYRISVASMLLRDTALPVNDIMYRVGFNDPTHFGKTFRQMCGMSPSSYRKNFCWLK